MDDVASYLAAHHGVFTRGQARRLGLTDRQIDWRCKTGEYVRVAPRVFRLAAAPATWESQARAAALSARGLVGFPAALALWGVDGHRRAGKLHVVVDRTRRPRTKLAVIHRINGRELSGHLVDGVPVTGCAQAVVDSAAVLSEDELEVTIDAVVRQRLATITRLQSLVERLGTSGRKGLGTLSRLLAERDSPTIPDSAFNRRVGQLLVNGGLPRPEFEWRIEGAGRFVARADLAYPKARLAIECDSERWHRSRQAFQRDPRRRNEMMIAGYQVLTFTWDDYASRPAGIVSTVRQALDQAGTRWGPSATPGVA